MTSKQQVVARDLLENTGKPVSKAMLDAGYAPTSAKNPQQLTKSKSWQKLMQEYLPDEKLIEKHKKLLEVRVFDRFVFPGYLEAENASESFSRIPNCDVIRVGWSGETTIVYFSVPDYRTQLEALKLAYKLKGKLNSNVLVSGEKVIAILNSSNGNSSGQNA